MMTLHEAQKHLDRPITKSQAFLLSSAWWYLDPPHEAMFPATFRLALQVTRHKLSRNGHQTWFENVAAIDIDQESGIPFPWGDWLAVYQEKNHEKLLINRTRPAQFTDSGRLIAQALANGNLRELNIAESVRVAYSNPEFRALLKQTTLATRHETPAQLKQRLHLSHPIRQ